MANLTEKQKRMVKAKIKGKTNREIARVEYPNATQAAADVSVSRQLKKPHVVEYMESGKLMALQAAGITWTSVMKPIKEALEATVYHEGDDTFMPHHTVRLAASKRAEDLLKSVEVPVGSPPPESLNTLIENSDEVELQRILFRGSQE